MRSVVLCIEREEEKGRRDEGRREGVIFLIG